MNRAVHPTGALVWAPAVLLGAWAGWTVGATGPRSGRLVAASVVGVVSLLVLAGCRRRGGATAGVVALVAVAVAGAGLAVGHRALLDGGPVDRLARGGGAAHVVGTVAAEPALGDDGRWWTLLRLREVDADRSRERTLLRGDGDLPLLGTTLAMEATARPLDDAEGFDAYLRRRHVVARLDPVSPPRVVEAAGPLLASTEHVRARTRGAAATRLTGDRAGLAVGLVTGDTRMLSGDTADRMGDVGLSHLVAVSGSNVAIVVGGAALLVGLVGGGARARRIVVVAAVAWFVVLTRAEPSVLRAAAMAGAVLLADARGTGTDAVQALAAAVLVLLVADPALAGSLGLLLSVAATAGVLVVAPRLADRLTRWPRLVATVLGVTLGAQLAVAPVLLVTVGEVPLSSVPANLLAVPAAALASTVVGLGALVAVAHVGVGGAVMALADPALRVVLVATRVPDLPVVSLHHPVLLVVAGAVVAWLLAPRRHLVARAAVAVASVTAVLLVPVARPAPDVLTVTAIDVGQGDAILVEGGGARILVDAGPDEDTVADWLGRHGIGWLDLVVQSHPHADHAAGLPAVLTRVGVGALWVRPVERPAGRAGGVDLEEVAAAAGVPVAHPVAGQRAAVGGLVVHVLSPPRGRPFVGLDAEVNEMSLVLRVDQGARRALLTGDVELAGIDRLLAAPAQLRAGLLKVPHHGSATTPPVLFAAVGAEVALVSAGRDNDYGHPHPDTLDALARAGTAVHRTDRDGSVSVEVPPVGSPHDLGAPADGRRRPAAPAGDRAPARRPHLGRRRARRRHLRRQRARRPP